jgi:hypothetical protein
MADKSKALMGIEEAYSRDDHGSFRKSLAAAEPLDIERFIRGHFSSFGADTIIDVAEALGRENLNFLIDAHSSALQTFVKNTSASIARNRVNEVRRIVGQCLAGIHEKWALHHVLWQMMFVLMEAERNQ